MFNMRMKNVAAVAFVLVVTAICGAAQDQNRLDFQTTTPDAKAIVKQVAETYKNPRNYHFEGRYTVENLAEYVGLKEGSMREGLFVNAVTIKPDRFRIELKNPLNNLTLVSDGKTKWFYAADVNEYTKTEESVAKPVTGRPAVNPIVYFTEARYALDGFSRVADWLSEAKIIGEEKVEIGGQLIDCLVIEASYTRVFETGQTGAWTRKLWIDKGRNIVLREIKHEKVKVAWERYANLKTTYIFTVAKVGNLAPETLFTFVPPEGAREVAEMNSPSSSATPPPAATPRPNFVGKDAIAFALKDLDGNQVDLQSLKGKVTLLDFWASWCGPCVAELPHIEKLHRDFKDQGLVVLGVNDEGVEVARAFMTKKAYTFTTLVDVGKEVSRKYGVSGIPQAFIIDREGKVKWQALATTRAKRLNCEARWKRFSKA
jgi:peroxiredoxin/outer membrane lipoprotein-sorting protein